MVTLPAAIAGRPLAWKEMKSSGTRPPVAALVPESTWVKKSSRNLAALAEPGPVEAGPPTLAPGSADRTPATAKSYNRQ